MKKITKTRCHQYFQRYHIKECLTGNLPRICGDGECHCIWEDGVEYEPDDYIEK